MAPTPGRPDAHCGEGTTGDKRVLSLGRVATVELGPGITADNCVALAQHFRDVRWKPGSDVAGREVVSVSGIMACGTTVGGVFGGLKLGDVPVG